MWCTDIISRVYSCLPSSGPSLDSGSMAIDTVDEWIIESTFLLMLNQNHDISTRVLGEGQEFTIFL